MKTFEKNATVWVLAIDHKHGTDISVHTTEKGARKALYQYCAEWWGEDLDKKYGPLKDLERDDVIQAYFDFFQMWSNPEWYILECHQLEP